MFSFLSCCGASATNVELRKLQMQQSNDWIMVFDSWFELFFEEADMTIPQYVMQFLNEIRYNILKDKNIKNQATSIQDQFIEKLVKYGK